jgi:hypothetical protein
MLQYFARAPFLGGHKDYPIGSTRSINAAEQHLQHINASMSDGWLSMLYRPVPRRKYQWAVAIN